MKKFILNIFLFIGISIIVLSAIVLSPTTPSASDSLLFTSKQKDSLLENSPSPRLITLAGSSAYFGLDSRLLKDSLNINPINGAIHAGIGLNFILHKTEPLLKKGDIVILAFEYEQFCGESASGNEPLFRMIFDVDLNNAKYITDLEQVSSLFSRLPKYVYSKLDVSSYTKRTIPPIYSHTATNEFGDACMHWGIGPKKVEYITMGSELNQEAIANFKNFIDRTEQKGCKVYVSYPALQEGTFNKSIQYISKIDSIYHALDCKILGTPQRYAVPDSLLFDTQYHLNEEGTKIRTLLLIEDIQQSDALK